MAGVFTVTFSNTSVKPTVAVHDGMFHLDELVALSLLTLAITNKEPSDEGQYNSLGWINIIRTRDEEKIANANFVLDVGNKFDGIKFFDHHQKDCPKHSNGIPFAATGLVWETYYKKIASTFNVDADKLYKAMEGFILGVDANDTGKAEADKREVKLPGLAEVVKSFNSLKDEGFKLCLDFIFNYVSTLLANSVEKIKNEDLIQEAIEMSIDGILVLPKFCLGWKEACLNTDIKVALIDAGNDEWSITSALVEAGSQDCKCPCPESLRDAKELGGNPVVFIHKTGFTGKIKASTEAQAYKSAIAWVHS